MIRGERNKGERVRLFSREGGCEGRGCLRNAVFFFFFSVDYFYFLIYLIKFCFYYYFEPL